MQFFPVLDPAVEAALRASIERFGVLVPVVVDQHGRLLDGHHRSRLADELGVDCPQIEQHVAGEAEAEAIARTLNVDRRHLEPEQRRELAADLRTNGHSLRSISGALGVSKSQIDRDLSAVPQQSPQRVRGRDDKTYPSRRAVIAKPDLGGGLSHPARYSSTLLPIFAELLRGHRRVLDPFAGTGRINELRPEFETTGVELEPEWAALSEHTVEGNALALEFPDASFDAICTSPTYGNRFADHHNAADPHLRRSYTFDLGRPLHRDNSGALQWGRRYREFHLRAWAEVVRVLRPGGVIVLNVKDHTRKGVRQPVSSWHARTLIDDLGFRLLDCVAVGDTHHLRQGANGDERWAETVWLLRGPS